MWQTECIVSTVNADVSIKILLKKKEKIELKMPRQLRNLKINLSILIK